MSVRLAFGITAGPGLRVWAAAAEVAAVVVEDRGGVAPGSPVVVGPAEAGPEQAGEAIDQLGSLVGRGTAVAAGAGIDLGGGFTSARLAGATGDRRDAVLAALRLLGAQGAARLGDRTAVLVALFGLSATKRVGAAANAALDEGRWATLLLASAASELLGPEQLERVLELRAPAGIDPFPRGTASTLATNLAQVLTGYPRPRRLTLILSLWDHVCGLLLDRQRLARLPTSQVRTDRIGRLRERYRDHFDAPLLQHLNWATDGNPTLASAARFQPPLVWEAQELRRLIHDAIAATALLRFARTSSDEGLPVAVRRHRAELAAADGCLGPAERDAARKRTKGGYSHPARPGCYVHDLVVALSPDGEWTERTEIHVNERVRMARNYGVVVLDAVTEHLREVLDEPLYGCWDACKPWRVDTLRAWREAAGFRRTPAGWEQPPLTDKNPDGPARPLAERIAADPAADPAAVEAPHDLLWYADLADALAPFYGRPVADMTIGESYPELSYNEPPPSDRERPRADSVPLAVAGLAQLVACGATPPPRCGSWAALADGVLADTAITEAGATAFPIPPGIEALDGQEIPGTPLTVELGRRPRQLADWSGYMGNCIGGPDYVEEAQRGRCVLMALRGRAERIVANLDIRRETGGWSVRELLGRFNEDLDTALAEPVKKWVGTLARPDLPAAEPEPPEPRVRAGRSRRSAVRLPTALLNTLAAEVERAMTDPATVAAQNTYARLSCGLGPNADFEPAAAVIALKRLRPAAHTDLLRTALGTGFDVSALWRATAVRPLAAAVGRLPPDLREYDRITALTGDGPLPRTLRALVRRPEIAQAHAMDVVAWAIRKATGELLTDDVLAHAVAQHPSPELVCVLVIAATCAEAPGRTTPLTDPGVTAVPGFPATDLADVDARPAATDLGITVENFDRMAAESGLHAPTALLGTGTWQSLWQRAHRRP